MGKFTATHMTVIIVVFLLSIVGLSVTNHETAVLVTIGISILGGLGLTLGQQQAVKEQTNGNTTRLLQMLEHSANAHMEQTKMTANLLALMTPGSPQAEAKMIEIATNSIPTTAPVATTVPISPKPEEEHS